MQRVLEALNALRMNDPDRLGDWFGRFITLYRSAGHAMPADESRSRTEIEWGLQQGHVLHRPPWTRLAWRRAGAGARRYAGGETRDLHVRDARPISAAPAFHGRDHAALPERAEGRRGGTEWVRSESS